MFDRVHRVQDDMASIATYFKSDLTLDLAELMRAGRTTEEIFETLVVELATTSQKVAATQSDCQQLQQMTLLARSHAQLKEILWEGSEWLWSIERNLQRLDPAYENIAGDVVTGYPWTTTHETLFSELFAPIERVEYDMFCAFLREYLPGTQPQVRGIIRKLALTPNYSPNYLPYDFHEGFTAGLFKALAAGELSLAAAVKIFYAVGECTRYVDFTSSLRNSAVLQVVLEYPKYVTSINLEELHQALSPYCVKNAAYTQQTPFLVLLAVNGLTPDRIAAHHDQLMTYVQKHRTALVPDGDLNLKGEPWQVYAYLDQVLGDDTQMWRERLLQGVFDDDSHHFSDAHSALAGRPWWHNVALENLRHGSSEQQNRALELIKRYPNDDLVVPLRAMGETKVPARVLQKIVAALKACGKPLLRYSTITAIEQAAAKSKAKPKSLSWIEWDTLPPLICAETGTPAPPTVAPWLLKSMIAAKLTTLDDEFTAALACYSAESRQAFAEEVLTRWLAEDTRTPTLDEATKTAEERFANFPGYSRNEHPNLSDAEIIQHLAAKNAKVPVKAQTRTAAILALAGAYGGPVVPREIRSYLSAWPSRKTQILRLLDVLAERRDDESLAVLAQCAQSLKTDKLRTTAEALLTRIAERDNRSLAELHLLAIPRFGLDERGHRSYTENDKRYHVALGDDLTLQITNPVGKLVTSIPFTNARADIAELKKTCKKAGQLLSKMFLDALYTGTRWSPETWLTHIATHPITGRVASGVVWQTPDEAHPGQYRTFRTVGDGTFTDCADLDVPAPTSEVWVAHATTVPEGDLAAWQEVFEDYEIHWLLPQFDAQKVDLTAAQTKITDREGHILNTFALRTAARKAGYSQVVDDGAIVGWSKAVTDNHMVILGCTPVWLPMERDDVALTTVTFCTRNDPDTALPLADCPPVALSLAYTAYHQLAALGSGYRADWEDLIE